jgi:hypothetical protein
MWVFVFILFVIALFYPKDTDTEAFANATEDYQKSTEDKEPVKVEDYYDNPIMKYPQNYEIVMDKLTRLEASPVYYGYTGGQHKYIDDRYIDWSEVSSPLPVYADFFM